MRKVDEETSKCIEDTKSLPTTLKRKIISVLSAITEEKMIKFLSLSINIDELREEAIKLINRETTYIARIPKKLDVEMKNGLLDFMKDSKTGENLGVLVNGKHRSRGYMRIEEVVKVDIASYATNIAMQQQLANMAEVINDVRSRVRALQEGHDRDLFGSILGMQNQLLQMRDAGDSETRKQLATNAITVLNDVRGKAEAAILDTLQDLSDMPKTGFGIFWYTFMRDNFKEDTIEKYNRIEELFSYYLSATQLLGYAYAFLDEPSPYNDIFSPSRELSENRNLQGLIATERLFSEKLGETWYRNPGNYLRKLQNESRRLFNEEDNMIELKITGNEILEAMENGKIQKSTSGKKEVSDC